MAVEVPIVARSKLVAPRNRDESVHRRELVSRLSNSSSSMTVVSAPAGFGKSTLMAQCHAGQDLAVWLSLDRDDNDPVVLWSLLIQATREVVPGFGEAYLHRLSTAGPSVVDEIATAMANELDECALPVRFFIDDLHLIDSMDCLRSLHRLIRQGPETVRFFVATRGSPGLPLARLRVEGRLDELDLADLAMSADEAASLFELLDANLEPRQVADLVDRTEGWPAGLRLAAMVIGDNGEAEDQISAFGGTDKAIADYLIDEVLDGMDPGERVFLAQTAVLRRISGELCNAVTGRSDSSELLIGFEQSNAFLIPLDRARVWYRYHQLFAELLVSRLEREEPAAIEGLHVRASQWHRDHGDPQEAFHHAIAANRFSAAAEIVRVNWWDLLMTGRLETVRAMIERFDQRTIINHQALALAAALVYGVAGDYHRARLFIDACDEPVTGEPPLLDAADGLSAVALIRGSLALDGVGQAMADGMLAYEREPSDSPWRPLAALNIGLAMAIKGDGRGAEPFFEEASYCEDLALRSYALAELAIARLAQGRVEHATALADEACQEIRDAGLDDVIQAGSAHAAAALVALARNDRDEAMAAVELARKPMERESLALPMNIMRVQVHLAEAAFQLGEQDLARNYLNKATRIAARIGDTGATADRIARLRADWSRSGPPSLDGQGRESSFTSRELEVLALLHLGLKTREIAAELFLSRNTVKTYLRSVYRKLGVSNRKGALERAAEMGILANSG